MSLSDRKLALLESHCEAALGVDVDDAGLAVIPWADQTRFFFSLAQELAPWRDAPLDPKLASAADAAIAHRARTGAWPPISAATGRLLLERTSRITEVALLNETAGVTPGTQMPRGMDDAAIIGALLIFWCYELEIDEPRFFSGPSGSA